MKKVKAAKKQYQVIQSLSAISVLVLAQTLNNTPNENVTVLSALFSAHKGTPGDQQRKHLVKAMFSSVMYSHQYTPRPRVKQY